MSELYWWHTYYYHQMKQDIRTAKRLRGAQNEKGLKQIKVQI